MNEPKFKLMIEGPFDAPVPDAAVMNVFYTERQKGVFGACREGHGKPTRAARRGGATDEFDRFTGQDIMAQSADDQWFRVEIHFNGKVKVMNMPAESFSNLILNVPALLGVYGHAIGIWDPHKGGVVAEIVPPNSEITTAETK